MGGERPPLSGMHSWYFHHFMESIRHECCTFQKVVLALVVGKMQVAMDLGVLGTLLLCVLSELNDFFRRELPVPAAVRAGEGRPVLLLEQEVWVLEVWVLEVWWSGRISTDEP